ncbi:hypothetical protein [Kineococcus sp. SYSU DK003]|uniref:hypothetical protein n=1 Tax=Kineococcus sp. SYSU DK003 TaxID=3383124 RepID=UPI003D7DDB27
MTTGSTPPTTRPTVPAPRRRATGRHRGPGRPRLRGPRPAERLCLVSALACSVVAVVLRFQGIRPAAVVVAAVGLLLAVAGLVLGRRGAQLRRGSGSRAR